MGRNKREGGDAVTGPSLTERLAERLARPVPQWARDRARLHLLDWLGCVGAGRWAYPGGPWRDRAAAAGNALEMDDVHRAARLHPGPVVWSALVGQDWPMAQGYALDAAVRGYEAMVALGCALDDHHYSHFHPTATCGSVGAAATVAALELPDSPLPSALSESWYLVREDEPVSLVAPALMPADELFGEPEDRWKPMLVNAMAHAASMAGGLWRTRHEPGNATKQFHVAAAVATGAMAASFARANERAPRFILEGEQGLFAATCRQPRPERMFGGPDEWRIAEVSFKPWAACRHAHPAIDAALALPPGALAGDGPILVETYADALAFCDKPDPRTELEAKFSLQHAVAVVAVRGEPGLTDFDDATRADPAIGFVRARVRVAADPAITARYPEHFGARVTAGGQVSEVADALGDPERPMTLAQIEAKARALIAYGGLGAREADLAVDLALNLPEDDPGTELRQLIERWLS
jgi:2-methylcitrate dehydratase PrpD